MRIVCTRLFTTVMILLCAAGCASLPDKPARGPPSHALAAADDGELAGLESAVRPKVGPNASGFYLLDPNMDALRWRLAVVDAARHSLDVQCYFWWGDETGQLVLRHVVAAADRGVRVRLMLDDLTTLLGEDRHLKIRDWESAELNAHPNIELRLFNAFHARSLPGRALDFVRRMSRMNQRMHNKLIIADNRVVITGGRNIGNEYFGLSRRFNFTDLDTLGVGPVARHASGVFDRFWNSEWALPVAALKLPATRRDLRAEEAANRAKLERSPVAEHFPLNPAQWGDAIGKLSEAMVAGDSRVITDVPVKDTVRHRMPDEIAQLIAGAQHEVLITNAYVIPQEDDIQLFRGLAARGVRIRMLTNSLASQDVPAVNSHYKKWRKPLIEAGVELHEIRTDAAIKPLVVDTPPVQSPFMGLHIKAIAIDRTRVFIGSMNLDPRSAQFNSEMGVIVESHALGEQLAAIMERDMLPENAWLVSLDARGRVQWTAGGQVLRAQPVRNAWQRVQDAVFTWFPRSLY